jgi:nitroimidazol reductase NimA-like FMN-containing flavoprotein (pyridoxamine 5'-phosphate oxidase superfamily)
MRRKDKEISDVSEIRSIIEKAKVCRLGLANEGEPYVVPMSFGYQKNELYFHGALKGQKIDFIKNNPNVCFEMDCVAEPLRGDDACGWSMKFKSVIGFGIASFITDLEEKRAALGIIMAQYTDKTFEFPENKVNATAVIKVDIKNMTGKQSGF